MIIRVSFLDYANEKHFVRRDKINFDDLDTLRISFMTFGYKDILLSGMLESE